MSQDLSAATVNQVAVTTGNGTLFAATDSPHGRLVFVPSGLTLSLKFGANASATSFSVAIVGPASFAFPAPCYAGQVDAFASAGGNVQATQW